MLTQQKTREEARAEHGGRGVEKEATPVHESEKHYAESLSSIVSYRERMQEQQVQHRKFDIRFTRCTCVALCKWRKIPRKAWCIRNTKNAVLCAVNRMWWSNWNFMTRLCRWEVLSQSIGTSRVLQFRVGTRPAAECVCQVHAHVTMFFVSRELNTPL